VATRHILFPNSDAFEVSQACVEDLLLLKRAPNRNRRGRLGGCGVGEDGKENAVPEDSRSGRVTLKTLPPTC
jgi:hypothetical protein